MLPQKFSFGILHAYSNIWMKLRAKVIVKGLEHVQPPRENEKRVYIIVNHSTTYDVVALMHIAAKPFRIMMDRGAFTFPIIRHFLFGARFIPLDKETSADAVKQCVEVVKQKEPLVISLHDGTSTIGSWGRPRTGGIRIAHASGATIIPLFLYVEPDRIRHLNFKGTNGKEYPYTTFRNTRFWIHFLPPLSISDLPADAKYEDFRKVADNLDHQANSMEKEYEELMAQEAKNPESIHRKRQKGGTSVRVIW
jgi:1-acyl-sn-glycerol-3-phosphate acyltransferase